MAILQPDNKDKISNIIKESLKNESFHEKVSENSLSVPLKGQEKNLKKNI